jgi:hypothetical protein
MKHLFLFTLCIALILALAGCDKDEKKNQPTQIEADDAMSRSVASSSRDKGRVSSPAPPPASPGTRNPTNPTPNPPVTTGGGPGQLVFADPLTNGTTFGTAVGGEFTPRGYYFPTHWGAYLGYATQMSDGFRVEFDAIGYTSMEEDGGAGKMVIFEMFDAPLGLDWSGASSAWSNNSLFQFVKRGTFQGQVLHMTDGIRVKCGGGGHFEEYATYSGHSPAGHPIAWNPSSLYHWSFSFLNNHVTVTRNGQTMFDISCPGLVSGRPMTIGIGTSGTTYSSVAGVTYSNVALYRLQ